MDWRTVWMKTPGHGREVAVSSGASTVGLSLLLRDFFSVEHESLT